MSTRRQHWGRWIAAASLLVGFTAALSAQVEVGGRSAVALQETPSGGSRAGRPTASTRAQGGATAGSQAEQSAGDVPFQTDPDDTGGWRNTRPVLRIGQSYTVPAGTSVREVVVIGGDAVIEGRVEQNVLVVAGTLHLGREARVRGDLVAVASPVAVTEGAIVERDLIVVGSGFAAPATFAAGGEHVVIGTAGIAAAVQAVLPWATQGLLLGRLIVPSLGWMWWVIAVAFFVKLVVGFLFERPVRSCADQLRARPLSSVLVGLLVCLLVGPAFFILAVSVVGIIVIPFALCALFIAGLLGKIAVSRVIGASVFAEDEPGDKLQAARSFTVGFIVICIAYMVPLVGIVTYLFVGVFGLGAATMALFAGLRRENPAKPKPPRPVPTTPAPIPSSVPHAAPAVYTTEVGTSSAAFSALPPDASPAPGGVVLPSDAVAYSGAAPSAAATAVVPGTLLSMPKAKFIVRAAAFAIDVIVVLFAANVLIDLDSPREFVLLLLLYHVVFWAMKGTTLGGMVCNLRVIKTDGEPVGVGEATIRGLSAILSLVVFGLGALWILIDEDRQAWHDRFAGTYVVTVPKHYRGRS